MTASHSEQFLSELERRFGSDAAIGVRFEFRAFGNGARPEPWVLAAEQYDVAFSRDPALFEECDVMSLMPDGTSATVCTNYAVHVARAFPGRVRVVGFANEDNPNSRCAREQFHPGGHDFALIDDRWLVDPWMRLVCGEEGPIAYDLEDPVQARAVTEIYGPRECWSGLLGADKDALQVAPVPVFVQCSEENYVFLASQGDCVSVYDDLHIGAYAWLMPKTLDVLAELSADFTVWPAGLEVPKLSGFPVDELPGMYDKADLSGGWTDCCKDASQRLRADTAPHPF